MIIFDIPKNSLRKAALIGGITIFIIFGVHLFIIGCLVMKSGFIPRILGILLFIASFGYILIYMMHLFLPQYDNTAKLFENILGLPMALGELGLAIWMLVKGGKTPKKEN